jgi:CRISPR-associated protein Cmr6
MAAPDRARAERLKENAMPIAAVPNYLQFNDPEFYLSAPPGHRFLLYFAAWGENREKGTTDWRTKDRVPKIDARTQQQKTDRFGNLEWDDVENGQFACTIAACQTPKYDPERPRSRNPRSDEGLKPWRPMLDAMLNRQAALATGYKSDALLIIDAQSVAPFSTGLGNEHPLENGFAFLNPYGLPYLPGSGVKGVLRRAAAELADGEWGDTKGWTKPVIHALFGSEPEAELVRGALSFWDVIPQIHGNHLAVDIMTPHQSHYYQDKAAAGNNTPHESGQPNPISFLTVPPGSDFVFRVQCDRALLEHLAPDLAKDNRWQTLLEAVFIHAFSWLGFGAKTSVGYGAMEKDETAFQERADEIRKKQQEEQARQQKEAEQARLAALSPWEQVRAQVLADKPKDQRTEEALLKALEAGRWPDTNEARLIAEEVAKLLEENKQWREKSEKKNPEKDKPFQNTLRVKRFLS